MWFNMLDGSLEYRSMMAFLIGEEEEGGGKHDESKGKIG